MLVVEDEADACEALATALSSEGFGVTTARNGWEAFDVLGRTPNVDVIVLDLVMPGMNGWDLLEVLKQDSTLSQIPVVVLTAQDAARVPEADAFVVKPYDIEQLLEVVRNVL